MPSAETLIAFIGATALFAYMPGPAMLYAAAQTMARGRRAGLLACLGIHLGGYVHVMAAALGLSALFHTVPILYTVVKILGAAYLVFLGIRLIRQSYLEAKQFSLPRKSATFAMGESILVEILNPKAAIFFLAFLPQFVDPAAAWPLWAQLLTLGIIVNVMFGLADIVCVFMAEAMVNTFRNSSRSQKLIQRLGGSIMIGLGANLAFHKN